MENLYIRVHSMLVPVDNLTLVQTSPKAPGRPEVVVQELPLQEPLAQVMRMNAKLGPLRGQFQNHTPAMLVYAKEDAKEALALALNMDDFRGVKKYLHQIEEIQQMINEGG